MEYRIQPVPRGRESSILEGCPVPLTNCSYPRSLPAIEGSVFVLDLRAIESGLKASRESPRKRIMLQVHRTGTERVQRMVNFMQRGSYVRPHLHPEPESIENAAIIMGTAGFIVFDERGSVVSAHRLEAGDPAASMIDIEQGLWHTLVPLGDDTVILEIKRGPYDAATDKRFAPWAPEEATMDAEAYLRRLEVLFER
jgi:cupin fold WbuC family metalloprotein